jgi:hypothetical protein
MLECPYCFRVFRTSPAQLGARCPKCRMPLFEGSGKRRRSDKESGRCDRHATSPAVAVCARCQKQMCNTCRTRWHDELMCPLCVERSMAADEPGPQEGSRQFRQAWLSIGFALGGWSVLLLTLWPLANFHDGAPARHEPMWTLALTFLFFSAVPALMALGQAASALRLRGRHLRVATWGLACAGGQLGLMLGLLLLNMWHN